MTLTRAASDGLQVEVHNEEGGRVDGERFSRSMVDQDKPSGDDA